MAKPRPLPLRRLAELAVLSLCTFLILRAWGVEAFQVPTGSMAPTLAGHHRAGDCPACGFPVVVGRHRLDKDDAPSAARCYARAACPNCGCQELGLHNVPETPGEHFLVNKSLYALRRPRRWELVVFQLFGQIFIKRILGLPAYQPSRRRPEQSRPITEYIFYSFI